MSKKNLKLKDIKIDCKFYKGKAPCVWHKKEAVNCPCKYYEKINKRILIIKLGAIGDVIRTTPILSKLKCIYSNAEITWVSYFPEVLPSFVDVPILFNLQSCIRLLADRFDIIYNFDKDEEACALANMVKAKIKRGFSLKNGKCLPIDKYSEHKFLTGLSDTVNKANRKSYVQEIFEIAGFSYKGERYVLDVPKTTVQFPNFIHPLIGLNTGCGDRWKTRLWGEKNWIELAKKLLNDGLSVLLLGGEKEHRRNEIIAAKSGAVYLGTFALPDFINLVNKCDLIVTQVTIALHIALGFGKKIVLLNNIFNKHEFELYGLGIIIEPDIECLGCFKQECEINCMDLISSNEVYKSIMGILKK